jgi:hypothetical protein
MSPNIWSASRHVCFPFEDPENGRADTMPPKPRADGASRAALNAIPVNTSLKRRLTDKSENMAPKAKRAPKAKPTIETPPNWAYDVTGTYEIEASDLHHDISWFRREHGDNLPKFLMQIQYANNPAHKRIGRQLWANFYWGIMRGCLRFCPGKG